MSCSGDSASPDNAPSLLLRGRCEASPTTHVLSTRDVRGGRLVLWPWPCWRVRWGGCTCPVRHERPGRGGVCHRDTGRRAGRARPGGVRFRDPRGRRASDRVGVRGRGVPADGGPRRRPQPEHARGTPAAGDSGLAGVPARPASAGPVDGVGHRGRGRSDCAAGRPTRIAGRRGRGALSRGAPRRCTTAWSRRSIGWIRSRAVRPSCSSPTARTGTAPRRPRPCVDRARRSRALVYSVAVGKTRPPLLADLASVSGGRSIQIRGMEGLEGALTAVASELRRQYLIGYVPERRPGDTAERWRSISVRLTGRTPPACRCGRERGTRGDDGAVRKSRSRRPSVKKGSSGLADAPWPRGE